MFENVGFGAFQLNEEYIPVNVPDEIKSFVSGSYVNGKWSKPLPTGRVIDEYESKLKWVIDNVFENYNNFKPGDVTLSYAQKISQDINTFKNYMQIKKQVEKGWTTPQSTSWFYETYFDTYDNYKALDKWIKDQASLALQELMDTGTIKLSEIKSGMNQAKMNLYMNSIVPIGNKFSQKDQQFLRDVFVMKMDGEVTMDEMVRAFEMIAPHLTMAELSPMYQFAYQMILGNDLAVNVLNTDSKLPYYGRNVAAEKEEITKKYEAVANRIGDYLDPETDDLFLERLRIHEAGYREPNNPDYFVCGEVCTKIMENFRAPIDVEMERIIRLTKDYPRDGYEKPQNTTQSAEDVIRQTVYAQGGTEADVQALLKASGVDAQGSQNYTHVINPLDSEEVKSSLPIVLGLGFLLFLLFRRDK